MCCVLILAYFKDERKTNSATGYTAQSSHHSGLDEGDSRRRELRQALQMEGRDPVSEPSSAASQAEHHQENGTQALGSLIQQTVCQVGSPFPHHILTPQIFVDKISDYVHLFLLLLSFPLSFWILGLLDIVPLWREYVSKEYLYMINKQI